MRIFEELFEMHGFSVECIVENSYIADNRLICIPYTEVGTETNPLLAGVSFSSASKSVIKNHYGSDPFIGYQVFIDFLNGTLPKGIYSTGCIHNLDHSFSEIRNIIEQYDFVEGEVA